MLTSGKTKFPTNHNKLAVISGEGMLPQLIFKEAERIDLEVWAFYPSKLDIEAPNNTQRVEFNPLDIEGLFLELKRRKISDVVFAGKITRATNNYIKLQKTNNIFFIGKIYSLKEVFRIYFLFFSIKLTSLSKIISVFLGAPIMMSLIMPSLSTIKCPGDTGVKSYIKDLDIEPCS